MIDIKFSQFGFIQRLRIAFYVLCGCEIGFTPSSTGKPEVVEVAE